MKESARLRKLGERSFTLSKRNFAEDYLMRNERLRETQQTRREIIHAE